MQIASPQSKPPHPSKSYTLEDWRGGNCSLKQEFDYEIDSIEGEIPAELKGTLFRNGPGLLDIYGQPVHHPFDGDGMISAITFAEGRAYFRNRYVRTKGYCDEQRAQRMLYRGVFGTQKPGGWLANAFDLRRKNVANTNVIDWGGKLLALWEASHPHRLDPNSLETIGIETLNGVLHRGSPFAAHPKVDPGDENRESCLVTFAIKPRGLFTTITLYELDQAGQVVKQHDHRVPGFAFIHDFAITPNYCLFAQSPLSLNPLPYLLGFRGIAECIQFQANRPSKIWLMPRKGTGDIQMFETDPCFIFHHANAFEHGNEVIVDSICYETFPAIDHNLNYQEIDFDARPPGQLWRTHLNLAAKTAERHRLDLRACEFPQVHPDLVGKPHRWVFLAAAHRPQGDAPQQAIFKIDPESGQQSLWSDAPKGFVGEPIFVPRPNSTQEDDGWVFTLVYDATHHRTDVVILDGADLETGLIARLHLKHHIPYGLHGSFTASSD